MPLEKRTTDKWENDDAWIMSSAAAMVPFCAFLYGHHRGMTNIVLNAGIAPFTYLLLIPYLICCCVQSIAVLESQGYSDCHY